MIRRRIHVGRNGDRPTASAGTLIESAYFESSLPNTGNWSSAAYNSATLVRSTTGTYGATAGSAQATVPANINDTGPLIVCGLDTYSLRDIYIRFKAKMPGNKSGLKFCKVFGVNNAGNYANCTFGLTYATGAMEQVSFGDGTATANDTANVINLDGSNPSWIGRSYGTATVLTPQNAAWAASNWGTDWHDFKLHVKFNSGTTALNEVADGEFYVEIDGVVYVNATGLFNRHYSNDVIGSVQFMGYTQGTTPSFELWMDNIEISTGGFV